MDNVVQLRDFRRKEEKKIEEERLVRLAKEVMGLVDTAPCEYIAPDRDPA